jgi:(p)ppGpp synthase/HD superfamily hydrolase
MQYSFKIQKAIKFATKTHEIYEKQKRKGKDIPYITHPLTVGLILAGSGANDDVICA